MGLEIREAQSYDASDNQRDVEQALQTQLNEAREKQLKLEDALLEEKSKNLNLETQIRHILKYGTANMTTMPNIESLESIGSVNDSSNESFVVVDDDDQKVDVVQIEEENNESEEVKILKIASNVCLDKYKKMIKFKMPTNSILNRMKQDGIDDEIIEYFEENDKFPPDNQSNKEEIKPVQKKLSGDDGLNKYRKMMKLKMPQASIINRMRMDAIDQKII